MGVKWLKNLGLAFLLTLISNHPAFLMPLAAQGQEIAKKAPDPTILWRIVHNCLSEKPQCSGSDACPRPLPNTCGKGNDCKDTLVVLEKSARYLAMEDSKMCHCRDLRFFHGLALPRIKMTGAEDQAEFSSVPDAWQFAWNVAKHKIPDEQAIALAANPPKPIRSQDQLHIHIVRLQSREEALKRPSRHVDHLADDVDGGGVKGGVWAAVRELARERGWKVYGVLVMREAQGPGFRVVLVDDHTSPEREFTQYQCP